MVMLMLSHQPRPVYHIFEFSSLLLLTTRRPLLMFWTFVLVLLGLSSSAAQWLFSISSSKWLFSIHQQVSHGLNELPLSVVQAMATNWQKIACNHQQPLCRPATEVYFELHGRFICALPISSNRWKPTQKLLQRFCHIELKIWGYIVALGSGKTQISEIFKRSMGSIDVLPYSL